MTAIAEFPADGNYWLVKWVDGFRLKHLTTKTSSVEVLLEKIELPNKKDLRMSFWERNRILGKPYHLRDEAVFHPEIRVHVGYLPHLTIGNVFYNKKLIGHLPTAKLSFTVSDIENRQRSVRLYEGQEKPIGWSEDFPYKLLNSFEFTGLLSRFPKSQCVVFEHEIATIIIPKTVIFTRYFVPNGELVNAFTSGPWSKQLERIIHIHDIESGQKTGITSEGHWGIVLKSKVKDDYAPLVALLYFDEFGRKCAEAIYSKSLEERTRSKDTIWHCSADIPFRNCERPYRFEFSGFYLPEFKSKTPNPTRLKFLVTRITGSSFPSYVPELVIGRGNRAAEASDPNAIEEVDKPKPFSSRPQTRKPNEYTELTSSADANPHYDSTDLPADEFSWFNLPKTRTMEKKSSKRYTGTGKLIDTTPPSEVVSTGNDSYQRSAVAPGNAYIRHREPDKRFEAILKSFESLVFNRRIQSYEVFSPTDPLQSVFRGDNLCWNFLDADSRRTGKWPSRSWRILKKNDFPFPGGNNAIPRSALVISVTVETIVGYWIEIECKPKESGYVSLFIYDLEVDPFDAVDFSIEHIAEYSGTNLKKAFKEAFKQFGKYKCYRHVYSSRENSSLDTHSHSFFFYKLEYFAQLARKS